MSTSPRSRVSSVLLLGLLVVAGAPFGCSRSTQEEEPRPSSRQTQQLDEAVASAAHAAAAASSAAVLARGTAPQASTQAAPDAIAAQHVLVAYKGAERAPKGVTRSKDEARKRAAEVVTKARAGEDFSKLVAEYSDDPAAKERQGSLGKFTRDKMNKAFSDAAFALGVDQTSDPVETPFGFHVIRRNQ
ncbi:MAG: Peptidyl-prolyl cis-trans isomerase PpiD [Labilithrix sp.]|nr:Peptidyl-prolyl cis-trans isomerase PpiD [Labilithrix sp.]